MEISPNCDHVLIIFVFHLDQPFIIEITKSSIEFYGLWIFWFGYDNHLCGNNKIFHPQTHHWLNEFSILDYGCDNQLFNYTDTIQCCCSTKQKIIPGNCKYHREWHDFELMTTNLDVIKLNGFQHVSSIFIIYNIR